MYLRVVLAALCIAAVAGQDEDVCAPFSDTVRLDSEKVNALTVCHDGGRIKTRYALTCDFDSYNFQLEVKNLEATGALNQVKEEVVDPTKIPVNVGRMIDAPYKVKLMSEAEKNNCPNPSFNPLRSFTIPYIAQQPVVSDTTSMAFVNGDLYYRTTLLITEEYDTSSCLAYEQFRTYVHLECCAKSETPITPIVPPIHKYCLEMCELNPKFRCECTTNVALGTYLISVFLNDQTALNELTNAGLDFQFSHLQAFPASAVQQGAPADAPITPEITFIKDGLVQSVPPELEFHQSNVARVPPSLLVKDFLVNDFEFHNLHEEGDHVAMRAQVEYCRKGVDGDTRFGLCQPPRFAPVG